MSESQKKTSPRFFNLLIAAVLATEEKYNTSPWGVTEELQAAHETARRARDCAREELTVAIMSAPWGANGSVFITNRSDGPGSWSGERTL